MKEDISEGAGERMMKKKESPLFGSLAHTTDLSVYSLVTLSPLSTLRRGREG
jgi:hypothetical protein